MKIGVKLKQARLKKELTQENVASILNVSRSTISSWEVGRSYPDLESLVSLSDLYDFSLDDLLREDSEMVKKISKDSKVAKNINKVIIAIITICILVSGFSWLQMYLLNKEHNDIFNLIGKKVDSLAIDVIDENTDVYQKELSKFLKNEEFKSVSTVDVYIGKSMDSSECKINYSYKNIESKHYTGDVWKSNKKAKDGSNIFYSVMIDMENTNTYDIYEPLFNIFASIGVLSLIALIISFVLSRFNIKIEKNNK